MKKSLLLVLLTIVVFGISLLSGCSEAEQLAREKNEQAKTKGLTRKVTVFSSYTGQVVWEKTLENSYFQGTTSNGSDIDFLDLKTKKKISVLGDNMIVVIEEL